MAVGVGLESDFRDYYDDEVRQLQQQLYNHRIIVYNRKLSNAEHRAVDLNMLKQRGLPVLGVRPIEDFEVLNNNTKILVYTRPCMHNGLGKSVMDNREAQGLYSNYIGRLWIPNSESGGYTIKLLQIGKRRFKLIMQTSDEFDITGGKLVDIQELPSDYQKLCKNPIYQIDYISTESDGLRAIDFNQVENLSRLGIDKLIPAYQIRDSLVDWFNHYYS